MAYNQYSGYGGNPYGEDGGTGNNPYASNAGAGNPYTSNQTGAGNPYTGAGAGNQYSSNTGAGNPYTSDTGAGNPYSNNTGAGNQYAHQAPAGQPQSHPGQPAGQQNIEYVQPGPNVLSNQDFLSRVEAVKADIRTLTTHVGQIASTHQRALSSPDSGSSAQLESMITQTQVLNTSIKDQIKFLETDAVRSKDNNVKNTQVAQLKSSFTKQLQEYRQEEVSYERRYKEQIARQYRIVNPEATDAEVQEATDADWGNEGVFQTALKTNRSATANTVLGAVRARHNDIQKIERSLIELQQLMEDLATAIVLQDEPIRQTEQHTANVQKDTEAGNVQLDKGIEHARRARKLKWWCFFICLAIVIILGLVLGLYFGLTTKAKNST